ncbi:hypothetical protein [Paraburkholderia pallida]|uniref:Uncharacterized protein n=1 Tax=Paraburkholderia pallida TaxID=2547399 RepID=A0A4P7CK31_9BURK|nr:hypothetical protein [Paraburkholderia pallida]QBQ96050.1 hypothetical protein E1956_01875 [Paraburkholderia pallida]
MHVALSRAIAKKRKSPENRAENKLKTLHEKNMCVLTGRKMLRISGTRNVCCTSVPKDSL